MACPWIGVDLDGTLAHYGSGHGPGEIGAPIPAMVEKVRAVLRQGDYGVKIITARMSNDPDGVERRAIADWTERHIGVRLEATCSKDYAMVQIWDDRAVEIIPNTGLTRAEFAASEAAKTSKHMIEVLDAALDDGIAYIPGSYIDPEDFISRLLARGYTIVRRPDARA